MINKGFSAKFKYAIVLGVILIGSHFTNLYSQKPVYKNSLNKNTKVWNYQEVDQRLLHFGFCLGLNGTDFAVTPNNSVYYSDTLYPNVPKIYPGFHVNIVSEFRLSDNLAFRFLPGLIFTQRNTVFWEGGTPKNEFKIESNLLDFPMLFKYKAKRINNYRPYVITGGNIRFDMAAKNKYDEDQEIYVRLNKLDYFYELGFGIDYYLMYFKFTTEIKWSTGLRNMITDTPNERYPEYVNSIDKLQSSMFFISFYFE